MSTPALDPQLLDDLARVFAEAALARLLAEGVAASTVPITDQQEAQAPAV